MNNRVLYFVCIFLFTSTGAYGFSFSDDFEDNDISDWESRANPGNWSVSDGMVHGNTAENASLLIASDGFMMQNGQVTICAGGVHAFGIHARLDEQDSGISAYVSPDDNVARIRLVVNGSLSTTLSSLNADFPSGVDYLLTLTCEDVLLTFLIEVPATGETWQFTATDPNPKPGMFGFHMGEEAGAYWDWISVTGTSTGNAYMSWLTTDDSGLGDGDMCLEPGETIDLAIEVTNSSDASLTNAFGILQSLNTNLAVIENFVDYSTIAGMSSSSGLGTFSVLAPGDTPENQTYDMRFTLMADGGYLEQMEFCLPVGCGTETDVETGASGWEWGTVLPGWQNDWHVSSSRNHTSGGSQSFKCGSTGTGDYSDYQYGYLESPYMNLPLSGELTFWSWLEAQVLSSSVAFDGGIIQYRRLNEWIDLYTVPPYSHQITAGSTGPFSDGTMVYSGVYDWTEYSLPIPDSLAGPGAFRFVFGSDDQGNREGWYIDDLTVTGTVTSEESSSGAVAQPFLSVLTNPFTEAVSFRYYLPDGEGSSIDIFDIAGRLVLSMPVGGGTGILNQVWSSDEPSGVYFARLTGAELVPVRLIKL